MHEDFIHEHIARLAEEDRAGLERLIGILRGGCWPGGPADRTEPAARHWLRQWRPARAAVGLPVCSCAAGRCAVCN